MTSGSSDIPTPQVVKAPTTAPAPAPTPTPTPEPTGYAQVLGALVGEDPPPRAPKIKAPEPSASEPVSKGQGEDIGEILSDHERYEKRFTALKFSRGLDDDATLEAALELIDSWIGLYKLEPCDALIQEIFPIILDKHKNERLHVKVLQARAFMRFKQHKFQECLQDFLDFKGMVGPSAELAENTGHAYNSLGDLKNAEKCFLESLELMNAPSSTLKSKSNKGGVLLGLGLVKDRQGRTAEGLTVVNQALAFYKKKFQGVEHSLIAKTLMSVGKMNQKLSRTAKAEQAFREAVRVFFVTCGDYTPLTADARFCHAKVLMKLGHQYWDEAGAELLNSLENYTSFDSLNVYMNIIIEIMMTVSKWGTQGPKEDLPDDSEVDAKTGKVKRLLRLHSKFLPFLPAINRVHGRMIDQKVPQDGNTGVFYKCGGELSMLGGHNTEAVTYFERAIVLFRTVTEMDVSHLISECQNMIAFSGGMR